MSEAQASAPRRAGATFWVGALTLALLLAGVVSSYASPHPDGLEKVAEAQGALPDEDAEPSWSSSPMPDYAVPGIESESLAGGLAGVAGTLLTLAVGWGVGRLAGRRAADA